MDRIPNTSMDTVPNNIMDISYTRLIIIDKEIYLTMPWTLPNTSIDTVANNILDTSYTRLITIDKEIYLTMSWTDYQTYQWTQYPKIFSNTCYMVSKILGLKTDIKEKLCCFISLIYLLNIELMQLNIFVMKLVKNR